MHMHMHMHMYTYAYVYTHTHSSACMSWLNQADAHSHTYIRAHTRTRTHTHMAMHIYENVCACKFSKTCVHWVSNVVEYLGSGVLHGVKPENVRVFAPQSFSFEKAKWLYWHHVVLINPSPITHALCHVLSALARAENWSADQFVALGCFSIYLYIYIYVYTDI